MGPCFMLVFCFTLFSNVLVISSAPVRVTTFDDCKPSSQGGVVVNCCPPLPKRPILDFKPTHNVSRPLRTRRALQCLDDDELAVYKQKLEKAYSLLYALPEDDPRTYWNQHLVHCTYGSGSLDNAGFPLDVHFSWLFHPFHRWFLYFHERILQTLLGDPSFTIHFWNWDNDGAFVAGRSKCCSKAGNQIPALYADPTSPLFHENRSWRTHVPLLPLDIGLEFFQTDDTTQLPDDVVVSRNARLMHELVATVNTTRKFYGRSYRAGDKESTENMNDIGSLETCHAAVHFWVGKDMASTITAAKDPIFFAHHGNVERLWHVWQRRVSGPAYPEDEDFLDAEFVFYNENADLVRVKVRDALDTRALGYVYEETNDASWTYASGSQNPGNLLNSELAKSASGSKRLAT